MTMIENIFQVRAKAFCLRTENRISSVQISPAATLCFDIFSPPPGDREVITQLERLSSMETKIAPRSLRIAPGTSGLSAITCIVVSRVSFATALCQSAGRYPPPHRISKLEYGALKWRVKRGPV